MIPIPFAKHSYQSRSLPVSAQRCVNFFPEIQPPDAAGQLVLHGTPGTVVFVSVGTGPIHGLHRMNGVVYAVSGEELYSITKAGVTTLIGTVSGNHRVSMANNETQLCIVNGAKGYTYSVASGLAEIADVDFMPAYTVSYQDGHFLFDQAESGSWFISSLLDGTAYDSSDYGTTYSNPDNVVAVIADHDEVFVFGECSIDKFRNTGQADFPFDLIDGGKFEIGCAARHTITKMDNTIYWLGSDKAVYRIENGGPVQISTSAIEYDIQKNADVSEAFAYTYAEERHKFLILCVGNKTWGYDSATNAWHERAWRNPSTALLSRHRSNCYVDAFGYHLVGDYQNGNIYILSLDAYKDNGDPLVSIATSPPISSNRSRLFMSRLQVDIEVGAGITTGQGSNPKAMLRWSDDGARTYKSERWADIGKKGEYCKRVVWNRLGSFYNRVFELQISDPIKRVIIGAYGDIDASEA